MIRPAALLHHRPQHGLRADERAGQIHLEHAVPVLALHAHQQLVAGDAGVVHEDVDAAVLREDLAERRLGGRRVGHVHQDDVR